MRILFIDPVNFAKGHLAFNATIIGATELLQEDETKEIHLLLSEMHAKKWKTTQISEKNNLQIHSISISCAPKNRFQFPWLIYKQLFKLVRKLNYDVIFFLASDNAIAPIALILSKLYRCNSEPKKFIIFHNNLENINKGSSTHIKRFLWRCVARFTDTCFLVLTPDLAIIGKKLLPNASFQTLPHPTYDHIYHSIYYEFKFSKSIDFLLIGRHAYDAAKSNFLESLLSFCSKICVEEKRSPVVVALPSNVLVKNHPHIEIQYYQPYPEVQKYISLISNTRFAVIPPVSGSRLTASGVLADFLTCGIPVIAPNEGAVRTQTAPENQEFFFNELSELKMIIYKALTLPEDEYINLSLNIAEYSEQFDLKNTANKITSLLPGHYDE